MTRPHVGQVVYFAASRVLERALDPWGIVPERDGPWVCVGAGPLLSRWVPLTTRGTAKGRLLPDAIPSSAWVVGARGKLWRSAVVTDAGVALRNEDVAWAAADTDRLVGTRPEIAAWYLRSVGVLRVA